MIIFISGFLFALIASYMVNREGSEVSSYAWVHFILANIRDCETTEDCYLCYVLIEQFKDKFSGKATFYTAAEYEDQVEMLLIELDKKSDELLGITRGKMTVENILNSDKL